MLEHPKSAAVRVWFRKLIASLAVALACATTGAAQSLRNLGGGCAGVNVPKVRASLTLDAHLLLNASCDASPGSARFVLLGVALRSQVPMLLASAGERFQLCDVVVLPTIVLVDRSAPAKPVRVSIPLSLSAGGLRLAVQIYCVECDSVGCHATLTPGVEITIR